MDDNSDLADLPGPVRAELTRLRAERVVLVDERRRQDARLREADLQLHELTAHRDQLLADAQAGLAGSERADALAHEATVTAAERDALRTELTSCREERDRLRLRLLEAELRLADTGEPSDTAAGDGDHDATQHDSAAAEQLVAELSRELTATRQTLSWRITAPLRAVRRRARS